MIEYLKEHLALTVVLAVCVVAIIVIVILLALAKNTANKKNDEIAEFAETGSSQNVFPPISSRFRNTEPSGETDKTVRTETLHEPEETEPETGESSVCTEEALPETKEEKDESVPNLLSESVAKTTKRKTDGKNTNTLKKSNTKKNNKSKEGVMNLEDLKNAPIEDENDFYDEEDEADRIAKYSGKWVICRLVTANSKSADAIHEGENDEETFFFELRASNGEKLLTSEEYTTYNGALNGIETHKANIARGNFKITLSKKGDYLFKLLSGKNMLLCMGEHYTTKARCESAIESTKRFAETAIVDENVQDIVITPPPETDEEESVFPDNGYNGKWIISARTAADGEQVFYFELYASNGEKLLSSEEYTTYIGAINGIETHKANIARGNFRVSLTKRGDYIYKLLNGNGQLLCLGEHYKTKRRCESAIESVKRFAKNAPVLSDSETVNKNA